MTYRAKIDKRLIIRGRHPNWRVVAPMLKKKLKSKCHRHLWLSFVKFYFPFIERMVWLEILNTQESPKLLKIQNIRILFSHLGGSI